MLGKEAMRRHVIRFPAARWAIADRAAEPREFHWRKTGEKTRRNPFTIAEIQNAARTGDKNSYKRSPTS